MKDKRENNLNAPFVITNTLTFTILTIILEQNMMESKLHVIIAVIK